MFSCRYSSFTGVTLSSVANNPISSYGTFESKERLQKRLQWWRKIRTLRTDQRSNFDLRCGSTGICTVTGGISASRTAPMATEAGDRQEWLAFVLGRHL